MVDINGKKVLEGSFVKIVSLNPKDFSNLDETYLSKVIKMVGESFKVYEIDNYNQAWVKIEWQISKDDYEAIGVALSSNEIELSSDDYTF